MNSQYKYYLDGRHFNDPINWDKWEDSLRRANEIKAILSQVNLNCEFAGKAYKYLKGIFDDGAFDTQVELLVEEWTTDSPQYKPLYRGIFNISDLDINATKAFLKVKIQDNGYYSLINGNKSLEAVVTSDKSKNGVAIAPCVAYEVEIFDTDNDFIGNTIFTVRWHDAIKFLVAFMTDNAMGFKCDFLDYGGEFEGLCLTIGQKLSTDVFAEYHSWDVPLPAISYQQIIDELAKIVPIESYVDESGAFPVLNIVREGELFLGKVVHDQKNV